MANSERLMCVKRQGSVDDKKPCASTNYIIAHYGIRPNVASHLTYEVFLRILISSGSQP